MQKIILAVVAVIVVAGAVFFFDVDQTQEARLPEVTVEGGQMPEAEVKAGDVEIGEKTITVPTVDVQSPEEEEAETGIAN